MTIDTALSRLTITKNPALEIIRSQLDEDYRQCTPNTCKSALSKSLKAISVDSFLLLLDAIRIIIPHRAIQNYYF